MNNNLYAVEWSESQKCFHVDDFEKTLTRNLNAFADGTANDYKILSIAEDTKQADQLIQLLKALPEYKNKFKTE